ncbi:MAG: hypothetical protein KDM63_01690 [Verrucomicrobiae bacterium]|nr:hypothetical protein [Verrucomicrobiae bacterium]
MSNSSKLNEVALVTFGHTENGHRCNLSELEEVITKAECAFVFAGLALAKIREEKLHRDAGYGTFEKYCRDRWGFSRQRAYQLIGGAEIAVHLSTLVDIAPPANEVQVRPLVGRALDEAVEIWKLANDMAVGTLVTGSLVKKAIKCLLPEDPGPEVTDAELFERVLRTWRGFVECCSHTEGFDLSPAEKARLASAMQELAGLAAKAGFWACAGDETPASEALTEEFLEVGL